MAENVHSSSLLCPGEDQHSEDDYSDDGEKGSDFLPFRLDRNGIPVNWTRVRCLQQEQYILEELKPGLPEYDEIVAEFSRRKIRVTRIERLQNLKLLEQFKSGEEDMKKESGNDSNLKICYLYHGTSIDKKHVCENGLDQSAITSGNKELSFYFSNDPRNCMPSSRERNRPEETLILKCRVILDEEEGSREDLREYVLHEHRRAMVEYLIFCEDDNVQDAYGDEWRPLLRFVIVCCFGYIIAPYLIRAVLWALGFTAQGVAKGSLAAKFQSYFGITRGSPFATAQSIAATGFVSVWIQVIVGLLIGIISLMFYQW